MSRRSLRTLAKMIRPSRHRRNTLFPRFERFEPRLALAGDVLATVAGNVLTLSGDQLGNDLTVEGTAQAGEIVVRGSQTTINGAKQATFSGIEAIRIVNATVDFLYTALGYGDDSLTLHGSEFLEATLDGGEDEDRLKASGNQGNIFAFSFEDEKIN